MGRVVLGQNAIRIAALAAWLAMPVSTPGCEGLVDGPQGLVTSVTDGDTALLDNGLVVRLIGMQAPLLPRGNDDFAPWPMAESAKTALERLILGKQVRVRYGGARTDRHGRTLGQLFVPGERELWVQRQMLADGYARVYSFADNRACVDELLAAEGRARLNRLGIWSDPYYAVRRADRPQELTGHSGRYELVEGRVLLADSAQGRVYLNFGRTWKEDVTAVIDKAALSLFAAEKLDPLKLEGALVRIRGWVDEHDGPRIDVTHPEQIEVLATR